VSEKTLFKQVMLEAEISLMMNLLILMND